MIFGIGVDIVSINRIENIIQKWGDRFVHRVFTPAETNSSGENISRLKFIYQLGAGAAAIPFLGAAYGMIKGRFDYNRFKDVRRFRNGLVHELGRVGEPGRVVG